MDRHLMSGNEAMARGIYEAGVKFCSAYPGTPSTEIFEQLPQYKDALYCEWAPNEKVATEAAYGACIAGVRSVCAMKHVGLNVAADPMFTAVYNGVRAGFVIIDADDPSMHSSQNEQDNRWYAKHAKMGLIEPSDSQECKDFLKVAFELSERFNMPFLFRSTTRVSHSKSLVTFAERTEVPAKPYEKESRFNCVPAIAVQNHKRLEKELAELAEYSNVCPLNRVEMKGTKIGVITASVSYQYAKDAFPEDTSFLKLGLTNPLPMKLIRDFASKVDQLYVIEELDDFMEMQIRAAGIPCVGKELTGKLYEFNPQILRERIFGEKPVVKDVGVQAVSRPPVLCPGCPHRGLFYTLGRHKEFVIASDIGCYSLGASAPLNAGDTCVCMGGGFSVAMGLSKGFALAGDKEKKVFGVLGDSTFFHSGMTGAVEIAYNKGNLIPVVLDNRITGMTGQQDNPGSGFNLEGEPAKAIDIEEVLHAYGFTNVITVDPQDLDAVEKAVEEALASKEPAAIITRRPCRLLKRAKQEKGLCIVDREKCIGCRKCLSVGCPAVSILDGKSNIDATQCVGCTVCAQVCPVHAISKKED